MMWPLQPLVTWVQNPDISNLIFALLSFLAAAGCSPRWCAILTGIVYLALVL